MRPEAGGEESRERRLRQEADSALNLSRMLQEQLRQVRNPAPVTVAEPIKNKRTIHSWLDRLQNLTPEFLRRLVRPLYLHLFYYRLFPEFSNQPHYEAPPLISGLAAWSGFAPFLHYKQRVCRTLNLDYVGFGCPCRTGQVSVVLPVYNGERYIAAALESVLAQTYPDVELIVVDDGSTDGTPGILARYAERPGVRLLRQDNQKLPAALNAGFAVAGGEFLTWISADNLMHPEMLAELAAFLTANRAAEMVYADEELIDERGDPARNAEFCEIYQHPFGGSRLERPFDPGELNFVQNNFIGACFLYRAWAARAVGPYEDAYFGFEDYDFFLRMNALFRVAHLGKRRPLYSYRLHQASLTARQKELQIAARTRYFLAEEEERRRFFSGSFDITLRGRHAWFPELARAWRRAGHNVFEMPQRTEEAEYRHRVTRAFDKQIVLSTELDQADVFAVFDGAHVATAGHEWIASGPVDLEYPLLAIANAWLWNCEGRPKPG